MIPRFREVQKDVYRGGAPTPDDVAFLKYNLGVKKIISLDKEAGDRIHRTCKLLGIKHIMLPIDIANKGSLLRFLKHDITSLLLNDGPTFIHCAMGKDRTSLAIALFRCEHDGWSYQDAIKEALDLGFGIGVPKKVIDLYKKIIKQSCKDRQDYNEAYDIVSNVREYPSDYQDYTLGPWEQQSWSPYSDYRVREFPYSNPRSNEYPTDYPNEQFDTRTSRGLDTGDFVPKKLKREIIPQVGQYESMQQSMMGAGPSYVGTGFV